MQIRSSLIKYIDGIVGRTICTIASQAAQTADSTRVCNSFLVIRPGGIGDAVLTIPMLLALRQLCPSGRIDVLAEKRNSAVFLLTDSINTVYHYDDPGDLIAVMRISYDAVIDTEQWHRLSAIVARITSGGAVVGFSTNNRSKMLTHAVSYSHSDYEAESFMHLLIPFAQETMERPDSPFLTVPNSADTVARRFLEPLERSHLVALFPGGSVKEKRWGCDRFVSLSKRLLKKGYRIVVIGGSGDAVCGNSISQADSTIINLCGRLSLVESAAAIKLSAVLISGDSGVMHLAQGVGTSVVALFGPSNTKKWAPRSGNSVTVTKNLPCSPCSQFGYTAECAKTVDCLHQITEDEVFECTVKLLETSHGNN